MVSRIFSDTLITAGSLLRNEERFNVLQGLALTIGFYGVGELTQEGLGIPVPGSIIGMLFLFVYLVFRKQVSESLQQSSQLLIKNLALLLIPSSVGVITCAALVEKQGLAMAFTLSVSIVFSLIMTAWLLSRLSQNRC